MQRLANIRSLMTSMGLTAQEVLKALNIPEEDQGHYLDLLSDR